MPGRASDIHRDDVFDVAGFSEAVLKYGRRHGITKWIDIARSVGLHVNTVSQALTAPYKMSLRNAVMFAYWADLKLDDYIRMTGSEQHIEQTWLEPELEAVYAELVAAARTAAVKAARQVFQERLTELREHVADAQTIRDVLEVDEALEADRSGATYFDNDEMTEADRDTWGGGLKMGDAIEYLRTFEKQGVRRSKLA
jgi:hypothetical protein